MHRWQRRIELFLHQWSNWNWKIWKSQLRMSTCRTSRNANERGLMNLHSACTPIHSPSVFPLFVVFWLFRGVSSMLITCLRILLHCRKLAKTTLILFRLWSCSLSLTDGLISSLLINLLLLLLLRWCQKTATTTAAWCPSHFAFRCWCSLRTNHRATMWPTWGKPLWALRLLRVHKKGHAELSGPFQTHSVWNAMQGGWPRQSLCNSCNRVMDRICSWRCCRSCSRFFSPKSCDYIARVHPPCCIFSHSELMFLVRVWPEFYVGWLVGRWWLWSEQKANGQ